MGLPPPKLRIQIYKPEEEDLCEFHVIDISGSNGVAAASVLPEKDVIRVFLEGNGFGWRLPKGKESRFGSIEYSGADEYRFWQDEKFLYVAVLNPVDDTRRVALESFRMEEGHSDRGRRTRAFMRLEMLERIIPDGAVRFIGVQVPDEDARKLGLL